jgi:hypothetical protein
MPSTDTKPELTAKASMAQPVSQPAVYANGLSEDQYTFMIVSRLTHLTSQMSQTSLYKKLKQAFYVQ